MTPAKKAAPARKTAAPRSRKVGAGEPDFTTLPIADGGWNPVAPKAEAHILTVTPAMAEYWLTLNEHNRNIRNSAVNGWAVDMGDDNWLLNGETIKFTRSGRLIDGQHRVLGIVASGQTVESYIANGLDENVQPTIDIGITRSFADMLKLRGERNTAVLGSVVRRVYLWQMRVERANSLEEMGLEIMEYSITEAAQESSTLHFKRQPTNSAYLLRGGVRPTTTKLLELLDGKHGDSLREAARVGAKARANLRTSAAVFGLCYWLFERIDREDADDFFDQIMYGDSITRGDPSFALRRALGDRSGRYIREEITTAIIIKAWNYYRERRPMDVCAWKAGGRHPEAFPIPI